MVGREVGFHSLPCLSPSGPSSKFAGDLCRRKADLEVSDPSAEVMLATFGSPPRPSQNSGEVEGIQQGYLLRYSGSSYFHVCAHIFQCVSLTECRAWSCPRTGVLCPPFQRISTEDLHRACPELSFSLAVALCSCVTLDTWLSGAPRFLPDVRP